LIFYRCCSRKISFGEWVEGCIIRAYGF